AAFVRGRRGILVRRALVAADLVGLGLAFAVAILVFGSRATRTNEFPSVAEFALFAATLPAWLVLAKLHGLYDRDEMHAGHSSVADVLPVLSLVPLGSWLLYACSALTGFADPYAPKLLTFWALAILFVVAGRVAARAVTRRSSGYLQNMVVVGGGETGL